MYTNIVIYFFNKNNVIYCVLVLGYDAYDNNGKSRT